MAECTTPLNTHKKACSGKCRGSGCETAASRVWVVAASEGMISLFEKNARGVLAPIPQNNQAVFPSLDQFQKFIDAAGHAHAFDQLVVVGSGNDIAWVHTALPQAATRTIAAEIEYPLLSAWFKQPMPLVELKRALESVITS